MTTTYVTPTTPTTGFIVTDGNELDVQSGGIATATMVSGLLMVEAGGIDSGATVYADEIVLGSANADLIYESLVVSGGSAVVTNEVYIDNGGSMSLIGDGAIASNTTVKGGNLLISGRDEAIDTTLSQATIQLKAPEATISGAVVFAYASELVVLTATAQPSGGSSFGDQAVLSNFGARDTVDDEVISGGTITTSATTAGVTTVTISGTSAGTPATETFLFAAMTSGHIQASSDGYVGGTELTYVPCFCPGTRILTESGEVAVEDLRAGDRVVTVGGAIEPIRWIGRRSYAGRTMAGRRHLFPIRIKAGALADGMPKRDLVISPQHAMLIDGVLVPAHALDNGRTIVRDDAISAVTYIHIELDHHDAIWAEGAASETFVDDDGRFLFQSSEGSPVLSTGTAEYCAQRVDHGDVLETIRERLARRVDLLVA